MFTGLAEALRRMFRRQDETGEYAHPERYLKQAGVLRAGDVLTCFFAITAVPTVTDVTALAAVRQEILARRFSVLQRLYEPDTINWMQIDFTEWYCFRSRQGVCGVLETASYYELYYDDTYPVLFPLSGEEFAAVQTLFFPPGTSGAGGPAAD